MTFAISCALLYLRSFDLEAADPHGKGELCKTKHLGQIKVNTAVKVALKAVGQNLVLCSWKLVFERSYVLVMNMGGQTKALSRGFCLFDSGAVL